MREKAAVRSSSPIESKSAHETGQKCQGRACCEMQFDVWLKGIEKKPSDRTVRERQFHRGQRCLGERITETLCGG